MIRKRVLRSKRRINRKALRSKRKTSNKRIRKKSIRRRQKGGALIRLKPIEHYIDKLNITTVAHDDTQKMNDTKNLLEQYINERWGLWGYIYNICFNVKVTGQMTSTEMTEMSEQLTSSNGNWKSDYNIFTKYKPADLGIIYDANGCHANQNKIDFIQIYYDYFKELFQRINAMKAAAGVAVSDWDQLLTDVKYQINDEIKL